MKIGSVELENNVFLAPMAGVTDLPFRRMCRHYGCGMVYSEMISAKGLYYGDKKTDTLMKLDENEAPAAIQLFGSDPDIIAEVIPLAEKAGPQIIDINMGCPTPKIVNNGDGSALMKNPQLAGKNCGGKRRGRRYDSRKNTGTVLFGICRQKNHCRCC